MKLKDLLKDVPFLHLEGDEQEEIRGVSYSSKDIEKGFLFAALKGEKKDGFDFIGEAIAGGAGAILSDRPKPVHVQVPWVEVSDARESLALLSSDFYSRPSQLMKVIGITGTKGKTTITYLLEGILKEAGFQPCVLGTISYRGPDTIRVAGRTTPEAPDIQRFMKEMADRGASHCLMEVSSHALSLKRVWGISFDIAVFTNLSGEHLDYHHTMEDYFEAKKRLFFLNSKKRTAVVNQDDPWGKKLIPELPMATVTFGLEPEALVRAAQFKLGKDGIEARIEFPGGLEIFASPLIGKHNLYNILASVAIGLVLNIPLAAIKEGIAAVRGIPGRFERIENPYGLNVFVDYAHTDSALQSLLEAVRQLKPARILLVFGAGGDRDKGKRGRMGEVAGALADWIYLTSDNPRSEDPLAIITDIENGLKKSGAKNYSIIPDRKEAIEQALGSAKKGDYVLVAGKGHEDYQILKDRTISFSDAEVIREYFKRMEES